MTNAELEELRGEIYDLKVLIGNCLALSAAITDDPEAHLDTVLKTSVEGISKAENSAVRPAHVQTFRNAAAGLVQQLTDIAKAMHIPTPTRDKLQ